MLSIFKKIPLPSPLRLLASTAFSAMAFLPQKILASQSWQTFFTNSENKLYSIIDKGLPLPAIDSRLQNLILHNDLNITKANEGNTAKFLQSLCSYQFGTDQAPAMGVIDLYGALNTSLQDMHISTFAALLKSVCVEARNEWKFNNLTTGLIVVAAAVVLAVGCMVWRNRQPHNSVLENEMAPLNPYVASPTADNNHEEAEPNSSNSLRSV